MVVLESAKVKNKKRLGRGISAGQGKTAGRGTKGQKARAGYDLPNRYEGGQTPLSMRLPKLPGFNSIHKKAVVISLNEISKLFKDGEVVSHNALIEKGIARGSQKVKVLNNGTLSVKVTLDPSIMASESVKKLFVKDAVISEKPKATKKAPKATEEAE